MIEAKEDRSVEIGGKRSDEILVLIEAFEAIVLEDDSKGFYPADVLTFINEDFVFGVFYLIYGAIEEIDEEANDSALPVFI